MRRRGQELLLGGPAALHVCTGMLRWLYLSFLESVAVLIQSHDNSEREMGVNLILQMRKPRLGEMTRFS